MSSPGPRRPKLRTSGLHVADLRGVAQLATQATVSVSRIAEGVHQSVWSTMGVTGKGAGQTGGVTGLVYQAVRGAAQLVGKGADALLTLLEPLLTSADAAAPGSPQREAVLAALNGVLGDRLQASGNPLAIPMGLHCHGALLDATHPQPPTPASAKLLLVVHGLCMNDLQWQSGDSGHTVDHGQTIALALGYTPVYMRYNTGLHVQDNGQQLATLLEQLVAHWPVPVQEIAALTHSMGGLVMRSAAHVAEQRQLAWRTKLTHIVFLGTPHHGAPLERAGNWIDIVLGATPYSAPFAKLGRMRSAGITDLRYGFARHQNLPLPEGVACLAIAATVASKRSLLADRLVGDGLVPLRSALGQHDDPARSLAFGKAGQWIAYRTNHMELLRSAEVGERVVGWMGADVDTC